MAQLALTTDGTLDNDGHADIMQRVGNGAGVVLCEIEHADGGMFQQVAFMRRIELFVGDYRRTPEGDWYALKHVMLDADALLKVLELFRANGRAGSDATAH
jgi:hypothetical protein